ncbi:TIGR02757 family protein [Pontibacter akesuensis]|uniref:TIGR02757 family protein n=1 Tax=Pontibacter akesuensis TaxID=388950 RepID=A0A1I7FPL1_9BACT|nr:TIGR02757 family protein [Pontibacter akesuensis]GHA61136.1 TIGR02757 family protein [Pontibacter akesuensis]SFU38078.1 TIGR02757 family protein [Pontibacter akesuensis]
MTQPDLTSIKALLDDRVEKYNQPDFIPNDPVSIPHRFTKKQDIEISGFFAAILAWGQRKTIINNCLKLMDLMDNAPHEFILYHQEQDLTRFLGFKHRTFNDTDLLYLLHFFRWYYSQYDSLETAFTGNQLKLQTQQARLEHFHNLVFSLEDAPQRTRKHVATPARKSACKRLNMYLRWMVRQDKGGVDFGIWEQMPMRDLICPCDVHVERVARRLGLITRTGMDWLTAEELTAHLRVFDPADPVKYDYALFGLGVEEKF